MLEICNHYQLMQNNSSESDCVAGMLRPRYGSSTPVPLTSMSSRSLWIIIGVIGGITVVAVGLVVAVLCYRKCAKKQQLSRQNVYVSALSLLMAV